MAQTVIIDGLAVPVSEYETLFVFTCYPNVDPTNNCHNGSDGWSKSSRVKALN
jgi:hypothetical protein